jgi:hypothetical protein
MKSGMDLLVKLEGTASEQNNGNPLHSVSLIKLLQFNFGTIIKIRTKSSKQDIEVFKKNSSPPPNFQGAGGIL